MASTKRDGDGDGDDDASTSTPASSPLKPKKAAKKTKSAKVPAPPPRPVRTYYSRRVRTALMIVAGLYFLTVWFDGVGSQIPAKITPRVWLYFSQVAALFKNAGLMAIDYRAEGWSCADGRWNEIDVRPWFQIDSENKENRFNRTMAFYRRQRLVMNALDDYVVARNNASTERQKIGGVRFLSLRVPFPKPGEHVERHERQPLSSYPKEQRKAWYWTINERRFERCGLPPPPKERKKKDKDDDSNEINMSVDPDSKEVEP